MNHLGLFEGIGGFSLAARWAGWKTKGWVEINPFCQQVLKYHFPEAQGFGDIKRFSYATFKSILRNRGIKDRSIDVITGGFPCQPYSSAGLRKGTDDPRHLWPSMLRTIKEFKPRFIVGENVRGIISWSDGLVFEQVQSDMEAAGYEVFTFLLPACSVGAPHERYRTWFVAYSTDSRAEGMRPKRKDSVYRPQTTANSMPTQRKWQIGGVESKFVAGCEYAITYTGSQQQEKRAQIRDSKDKTQERSRVDNRTKRSCNPWTITESIWDWTKIRNKWNQFPTQSPLCSRNDGFSTKLAGITFPKHRRESIQAYGNAIVPQVAYQIYKAINEYENIN